MGSGALVVGLLIALSGCAGRLPDGASRVCYRLTTFTPESARRQLSATVRLLYGVDSPLSASHPFVFEYRAPDGPRDAWTDGSWEPVGADSLLLSSERPGVGGWTARARLSEGTISGVALLQRSDAEPLEVEFSGARVGC